MRVSDLVRSERAVSPVVGAILMVAITVVLAAVVGTVVLGQGTTDSAPTVSFAFELEEKSSQPDELFVVHDGGETLDGRRVLLRGDDPIKDETGVLSLADEHTWKELADAQGLPGDSLSAGSRVGIERCDPACEMEGTTITIVWEAESGETFTIYRYTVPE